MRITNIKIQNFRQYKNFELDFKNSKEHEIYSIIGQNGIGKTNILNSITWCLYGREIHLGDKDRSLVLPNLDILKNEELNNIITVKVQIEVEEKGGKRYLFVREADFKKLDKGAFELENNFYVVTGERGRCDQSVEGEMATTVLNWCFPEKISEYFFFDGEKLDKYFEKNTANSIEMSILEISDVKILNNIENRLGILIKDKNKEASRSNPDLESLNQKCELIEKKLSNEKENLTTNSRELKESEKRVSEISRNLKGIEDVKELEEEREKYTKNLVILEKQKKQKQKEVKEFIREYTILINLFPKVSMLLNKIYEKRTTGQFPPNINKKLLEKTLKSQICTVCGTHLIEDGINKIKEVLDQISFSTGISNLLSNLEYPLEAIIKKIKRFKKKKQELLENLSQLERNLEKEFNDRNKIDKKLASFPDAENVKALQFERTELETQSKKIRLIIGRLEANIETLEKNKNEAVIDYEKAKAKIEGLNKINKELSFLKKSKRIIEESRNELLDEIRDKIREETENIFLNLIWKKDTFRNITLDKNYNLQLFNVDGYECIGSCSAAERSFLALAFTLALHKISECNAPLVIDTPISRVSDKNRDNFAKVLKDISLEKQIVLLFTPSEYSSEIRDVLEPVNGFKLELETIDEKETKIGGNKW